MTEERIFFWIATTAIGVALQVVLFFCTLSLHYSWRVAYLLGVGCMVIAMLVAFSLVKTTREMC